MTTKPKILILEDDALIRMALEKMLEDNGFEVIGVAATGLEGIGLFIQKKPDLVLADIHLKGHMSGVEAAAAMTGSRAVPVIFSTAFGSENLPPGSVCVHKPYHEKPLINTLKRLLGL